MQYAIFSWAIGNILVKRISQVEILLLVAGLSLVPIRFAAARRLYPVTV